ncbi:kinase-like domain-containing protein [Phaeosphaeriaceae sp. PMI808]|nr:kinase-like domain-containing protein [Phaeosphaeriaceae sp. PMI808]
MASPAGDTEPDIPSWDGIHLGVPNGDFARLVPQSPAARKLFSQVARRLETDRDGWHHVRRFIYYEATILDESTTDSSFAAMATPPPQDSSPQDFCGYYRLNMNIPPENLGLGWVLGSSRPNKPDNFVDFLLAPYANDHGLHSRHCRLRRLLDSGVLLAVSDSRKVSVDGKNLQRDTKRKQDEQAYQASLQHRTSIRLGDLAYLLVFTDLSLERQQTELQRALQKLDSGPGKSVMLLSPTPLKPMIDYHGYSIFDANLHGSTSTVSLGYDQSNGKPVVVKMVKCRSAQFEDLRIEIGILGQLNHGNVCKLEKVVNFDYSADPTTWRQDEGPTVGLIMSPPATTVALGLLATWKSLPDSTTFLTNSMHQLASGLAYIHSLDVLHRDIKPDNIVYCSINPVHAVIIDFGCSVPTPKSTRHDRGTITYLAPEVMKIKLGKSTEPFSFPSDVWSLGATLLDFLFEKKFNQKLGTESCYQLFKKIMEGNAVELHYPEFWDLVLELLAWNPDRRPSALEIARRFPGQSRCQESRRPVIDKNVLSKRGKSELNLK